VPDEATQAPAEQETPSSAAPPEGSPAPESEPKGEEAPAVDYEKRFNDLQPELTKAQQRNAEFERTLQAAREGNPEALEALGIEYEEEDAELEDPDEVLRNEVAQLREHVGTQQQQAERSHLEEMEADYIAEKIDVLEKETGIELDDDAIDFVIDRARANRGDQEEPLVENAFNPAVSPEGWAF